MIGLQARWEAWQATRPMEIVPPDSPRDLFEYGGIQVKRA
jgi:hypothetical protein